MSIITASKFIIFSAIAHKEEYDEMEGSGWDEIFELEGLDNVTNMIHHMPRFNRTIFILKHKHGMNVTDIVDAHIREIVSEVDRTSQTYWRNRYLRTHRYLTTERFWAFVRKALMHHYSTVNHIAHFFETRPQYMTNGNRIDINYDLTKLSHWVHDIDVIFSKHLNTPLSILIPSPSSV